ncbi:unnamed protein product [Mytilus edulis]|uniref:Uncharacterized protein n=1 Tax=Mytilus edulis TaxID=6550 RepID=A0A8S3V3V9_MYTED|nr:unnamed protein product [Mytilus edulis]
MSSEESVTKVYEEDKNDGLSKTELLTLFCGALSGIIVLLGFLGISNFVKKRMCMSKSKRDKPSEREEHTSDEHGTLDAVTFHESLYEIIDDSHLDSIFVPQTVHYNPRNDDESQSSINSANYNDDRSSYLEPVNSSPISKISSSHRVEQSQKTFSSTRISTCIQNQTSCNLGKDNESSSSRSSTNSNDDQSIYLHPLSIFITNDISCYTEEQSRNVLLPSANNFTCIADRTSCDPYLAIKQDNSDDSDDSSSEFSEDATHDRSSYLHPYNTLFNKTSSCHIYKMCQNKQFSE